MARHVERLEMFVLILPLCPLLAASLMAQRVEHLEVFALISHLCPLFVIRLGALHGSHYRICVLIPCQYPPFVTGLMACRVVLFQMRARISRLKVLAVCCPIMICPHAIGLAALQIVSVMRRFLD